MIKWDKMIPDGSAAVDVFQCGVSTRHRDTDEEKTRGRHKNRLRTYGYIRFNKLRRDRNHQNWETGLG